MKHWFLTILTVMMTATVMGINPEAILGDYVFRDDVSGEDAKVRIYSNGQGGYDAKIIWLAQPNNPDGTERTDEKNPDPQLRSRKAYEIIIAYNLIFNLDKNRWETNRLYHPSFGRYFKAYMVFESENILKVRGYLGTPAIGQTQKWKKVK